jgi:hypothetical protein
MILRTLNFENVRDGGKGDPVSSKRMTTQDTLAQIRNLDLASHLFGYSGWKAPLQFSWAACDDAVAEPHREFVAIDRFLSGAAIGAKFNAKVAHGGKLKGLLSVDLERLAKLDPSLPALGLLALVLRDLAEGDIAIGSGSAKGYGACSVSMTIDHNGEQFGSLEEWLNSSEIQSAFAAFSTQVPTHPNPSH